MNTHVDNAISLNEQAPRKYTVVKEEGFRTPWIPVISGQRYLVTIEGTHFIKMYSVLQNQGISPVAKKIEISDAGKSIDLSEMKNDPIIDPDTLFICFGYPEISARTIYEITIKRIL